MQEGESQMRLGGTSASVGQGLCHSLPESARAPCLWVLFVFKMLMLFHRLELLKRTGEAGKKQGHFHCTEGRGDVACSMSALNPKQPRMMFFADITLCRWIELTV